MRPLTILAAAALTLASPSWADDPVPCLKGQGPLQTGQSYCPDSVDSVISPVTCSLMGDVGCSLDKAAKEQAGTQAPPADPIPLFAFPNATGGAFCTDNYCPLVPKGDSDLLAQIKADPELYKKYQEMITNPPTPLLPEAVPEWALNNIREQLRTEAVKTAEALAKEGAPLPPGYTVTTLPDGKIKICSSGGNCDPFDPKNPPDKYLAGLKKLQADITKLEEQKKEQERLAKEEEDRKKVALNGPGSGNTEAGRTINMLGGDFGTDPAGGADGTCSAQDTSCQDEPKAPGSEGSSGTPGQGNPGAGTNNPEDLAGLNVKPTGDNLYAANDGGKSGPDSQPIVNPLTGELGGLSFNTWLMPKELPVLQAHAQEVSGQNRMGDVTSSQENLGGIWSRVAASLNAGRRFFDGSRESTVDVAPPTHCNAQDGKCLKGEKDQKPVY